MTTLLRNATLAISVGIFSGVQVASAVKLADGTVYFAQPPSLVSATTTYNGTSAWTATYYFTVTVPENAGEALQRVTITQDEGADDIEFDLKDSRAFQGTGRHRGDRLALGVAIGDDNKRMLAVTFDPPVPPGKTVTIALDPVENPRIAGVYLFGVTAFPVGEKAHGQFLGFGRLHFYESFDFRSH